MPDTNGRRHCARCGAWLASDNPATLCSPCQSATPDPHAAPPDVPIDFWHHDTLQAAFDSRHMGKVIRAYRQHPYHGRRGLTQDVVAGWAGIAQSQVSTIEGGPPINNLDRLIDWAQLLGIPEEHLWFKLPDDASSASGASERRQRSTMVRWTVGSPRAALDQQAHRTADEAPADVSQPAAVSDIDGIGAIELIRRTEASDLGPDTLAAIVRAVEGLAKSYTHMVPAEFLASLRNYQGYVMRLLDGRTTLAQRRELMRQAGWLSLLVATAAIDVGQNRAAVANFGAAHTMARETGDDELAAWVFETEAWHALSAGRADRAAELCRAGLDVAQPGTSAHVQLCTQVARASARLGDRQATRRMVDVSLTEADRLPSPVGPEHHFTADRRRVLLHCGAALVWLGGSDAEEYARRAVSEYEAGDYAHHLATARLNLAILLTKTGEPSEAVHVGQQAVTEAGWRLCHTDLFLTDTLDQLLTSRYDTAEARTWTEQYTVTKRDIMARQPVTASMTALPENG